MVIVFLVENFFASMGYILIAPMILARTDNDALIYASVQIAGAIGGVVGGVDHECLGRSQEKSAWGAGWFIMVRERVWLLS